MHMATIWSYTELYRIYGHIWLLTNNMIINFLVQASMIGSLFDLFSADHWSIKKSQTSS